MKTQLKEFQKERILISGPEAIFLIFWKRMWQGFLPLFKNLPEAKLKCLALMALAEEISRQPRIDSIAWLFMAILMPIYNEKEQAGIG